MITLNDQIPVDSSTRLEYWFAYILESVDSFLGCCCWSIFNGIGKRKLHTVADRSMNVVSNLHSSLAILQLFDLRLTLKNIRTLGRRSNQWW